jgi:hypothetical protein
MKKTFYLFSSLAILGFIFAIVLIMNARPSVGAPSLTFQKTINPETTSTYELGTSTKSWLRGTFDNLCLTGGTCISDWASGAGSVTSVDMSVPTGLTISGNPITTSGTLALSYLTGYSLPKTASTTEGSTAYTWGNHALAGYLTALTGWSTTSTDYWLTTKTTDNLSEGSTNKYWSNILFDNRFYSSFATSTDRLIEGATNLFYTDARVGSVITASTTIAKTNVDNPWTVTQDFTNLTVANSSSTQQTISDAIWLTPIVSKLLRTGADGKVSETTIGAGLSFDGTTLTNTITQYTDALARASLSETVTGIDYNNTTGIFSDTTGYAGVKTASSTEWYNFNLTPSTRITAGNFIDWTGNTLDVTDSWYNSSADVIGGFTSCTGIQYLGADGACHNDTSGSITGGTAGMLASWIDGTTLTATSSPTVGYITSTTTTNSVFAGAITADLGFYYDLGTGQAITSSGYFTGPAFSITGNATSTVKNASTTNFRVNGVLDFWGTTMASFAEFITKIRTTLDTVYCQIAGCTPTGTWDMSGATVKMHVYPRIPAYATTTTWTATTTRQYIGTSKKAETFNSAECTTLTGGFLNVQFYNGTSQMNMCKASSTPSNCTLTVNNSMATSSMFSYEAGTTTTSVATGVTCSFDITR